MPFFTKQQRRQRRAYRNTRRLERLAQVHTVPASSTHGQVVAVMMTSKPDPQRGEKLSGDYLHYIHPWWNTIDRIGLAGTILHDGLPQEMIDAATTERIAFHRVEPGELPILHERHRLVRNFLRTQTSRYVFVTDISDVAFKRDPFALVEADAGAHRLFIGSEEKTISQSRCLRKEITEQFGTLLHGDRQVVNPGILGGTREEVIALMHHLLECIESLKSRLLNSDMSIVNKVVHDNYLPGELFTGFPLHSQFKKWQYRSRAAILHK